MSIGKAALVAAGALALGGCAGGNGPDLDLDAARTFDRHPLYWLGERFEEWELEHIQLGGDTFVTLIYGRCEVDDPDGPLRPEGGSCSPPLQLQIQPLCAHLDAVARAPIWRRRQVRGAPVGTIDGAPVLFTNRVQVKVYRGEGPDAGAALRALRVLRSVNDIDPVLSEDDPIPPADLDVLAGTRPCS